MIRYGSAASAAGVAVISTVWPRGDSSRGSTANFTAKDAPAGGTLSAFNATTGEGPLWTWQAPGYVNGSGMRYQANGKQFVAVYHQLPSIGQPLYNGHGEQLTAFSL